MQKVYLLLRNNAQTGPFDLPELLQFDLKPFDLIWIEGKSAGWYYPQEIEALRPHLPFLKKEEPAAPVQNTTVKTAPPSPRKVFVSMPSAVAAAKEEAKPQPATAPVFSAEQTTTPLLTVEPKTPAATKPIQPEAAEIRPGYARTMEEMETDYMNWAYVKKAKKKTVFSKSGIVVLCLLSVALFAVWKIANKPKVEGEPSIALPEQTTAQTSPLLPEEPSANEKPAPQKNVPLISNSKKEKAAKNATTVKNAEPVKRQAAAKDGTKETATDKAMIPPPNVPAPVVKEESKPVVEERPETATTEAPKKKKLRDKILDIFKKKPEEKTEEAKPADNDNGSRQSTRREAGSSLAQMVTVKFDIPNDWMMGIKGAKATLTNKSSETLAKAVIEVRYYNDDNDLLDRKTIAFANVKSKSTQTVSVPEHATATRLEYSVVSALGAEPLAVR